MTELTFVLICLGFGLLSLLVKIILKTYFIVAGGLAGAS